MTMKRMSLLVAATMFAVLFGCADKGHNDQTDKKAADKPQPIATEKKPAPPVDPQQMEKLSASHILVMHKESERVPAEITRTKEEALARAKEALAKISSGTDFAEVAKEFSDCPSKARGGDLGQFPPHAMAPAFTAGVKALKNDGVSSEPVETKFGYHIIKRQEVIKPVKLSASMIVVMHKDSQPNPVNATRTKEEALARANEALAKLKGGADFVEVAKEYSDHPNKSNGGSMGNFPSDRVPPTIAEPVKALTVGQLSAEPVDSPLGYHLFRRDALIESIPMSASMIIVTHKDSQPNPVNAKRTKEEALARIKEALVKIAGGTDFAEVAKEYTDHPNKVKGGDMGTFPSEMLPQDLVTGIKALKMGEVSSEPLDLSIGYHVIKRQEPGDMPAPPTMGRPPMPPGAPGGRPMPPGAPGGRPMPPMPPMPRPSAPPAPPASK
jgi:parvulin-like peptidyl-prolyl isomerase